MAHLDHMLLSTIPMEANLYRAVRAMVPSVKAVRVPAPFTCYVSIEQRLLGQAKNAILAVLGADLYMKRVVVVDQDVDIFDDRQVTWAIATRCQPDRDITIITNARGSDLDPSLARRTGYSAKWGVDATAKPSLAGYTPRHRVPPAVWKRLNLKDYVAVARPPRVVTTNFAARLAAAARRRPEHPALVWDGGALSWRELEARAAGMARRLAARGRARGRRRRAAPAQHVGPRRRALGRARARRHGGAAQPAAGRRRARAHPRPPEPEGGGGHRARRGQRPDDGDRGRRRAGRHPLHVGQHRAAQGRAALPRRARGRQRVLGRPGDGAHPG